MRRNRLNRFIPISILVVAAVSSGLVRAAGDPPPAPTNRLRVAAEDDLAFTLDHYLGKRLQTAPGKELGTVEDFLLEPRSGWIRYAVVSTGGFLGLGAERHLVPFSLLTPAYDGRFTARIAADELDTAPGVDPQQFADDRVVIDQSGQRQIQAAFTASAPDAASNVRAVGALTRASKLEGRDVDAESDKVGQISDVVILRGATHAMAVLQPVETIAQGDRYLVPLRLLRVKPGTDGVVATSLSPDDLKGAARVSAAAPPPGPSGVAPAPSPGLMPTGRTGAAQLPAATPAALRAAEAIRGALDQDETLSRARVIVTPRQDRVVVHGTVPSDKDKAAVEHVADRAADAASIDFNLAVESK